jgi:two-component system nitrate/nitrite response regulator NarP
MAKRVLIADDVPEIRHLLGLLLALEGEFEVVAEASNGAEALARSREAKPDVVLLDMNMPVRSGLDVLPEIRTELPGAVIAVFSGFEESVLGDHARSQGADLYLEKGLEVDEIKRRLRGALEGRPAS